jgi:hypothetical protein
VLDAMTRHDSYCVTGLYGTHSTHERLISPMCPISPIRVIAPTLEHEDEPEHEHDYPSITQSSYTPGFTSFT